MDIETLEDKVRDILEDNESARADDMTLYAEYVYRRLRGEDLGLGWLVKVFSDRRYRIMKGIAGFESVSRCRRKIQEKDPELRPEKEVIKIRKEEEKKYRAYARGEKC